MFIVNGFLPIKKTYLIIVKDNKSNIGDVIVKILLFTHKSDIDGMGNVILAKLAFDEVEYVLCETFNLQNEIKKYYDYERIYNYDMIFITDLWLEEPTLSKVTSLFYEWLVNNGYIDKNNQKIEDFSELTRKYDTWE